MKRMRAILSLLLVLVLLLGCIPTAAAATVDTELQLTEIDPTFDPRLPELFVSDQEETEPPYGPEEIVRVSIVLKDQPAMDKGYPIQTIGSNLAAANYRNQLRRQQDALTRRIEETVLDGEKLNVAANLTLVANLISADVEYGQIEEIEKVPGVQEVVIERVYQPLEAVADPSGDEVAALGQTLAAFTGAGARIAIVDSGVNNEHQSFSAAALDYALRQSAPDTDKDGNISDDELNAYKDKLNFMEKADVAAAIKTGQLHVADQYKTADQLYKTGKVPFAYNYADNNLSVLNGNAGIHGSHVAGIAAANTYIPSGDGFTLADGTNAVVGTAPDAQILNMKVFGDHFCTDSVIATAIEDAIVLGADVLNLSLGTAEVGFSCADAIYAGVLEKVSKAGILIMGAVGNDGAWMSANKNGRPNHLYSADVNMSTTTPPSSFADLMGVAWSNGDGANGILATMNESSSYGIPSSLMLQPEITADGTTVNSVNGDTKDGYTALSGTSMAAPDVAGAAAVVAQYLRTEQAQFGNSTFLARAKEQKNSLNQGMIAGGLLMSTADPMRDENGHYYSLLRQGAGLLNVVQASSAKSFIEVQGQSRGRVKAEVGDCPNGSKTFHYTFTLHNVSDTDRSYYFQTDLFTEDTFDKDGYTYLADNTRDLMGAATYTVNGKELNFQGLLQADVDQNHVTDARDAQALLDYLSGKRGETGLNLSAADVDGDNTPTTYDAHLILKSLQSSAVSVPANSSITVEVTLKVLEDLTEYPNGAYLEGFTSVVPVPTGEQALDVTHTIPILGFCGNWSDPSMFDRNSYLESSNGTNKTVPYTKNPASVYEINYMTYQDQSGNILKQATNPYASKQMVPLEKLAMRSSDTIYNVNLTLIRPAGAMCFVVMTVDKDGNRHVQYMDALYLHLACAYPAPNAEANGGWNSKAYNLSVHVSLEKLLAGAEIKEGDVIELGAVAVPEYYEQQAGKKITKDHLKSLIEGGKLGKGAYLTTKVTIDNTAPTITSGKPVPYEKKFEITAEDDQNVAYMALCTMDGVYRYENYTPDPASAGKTVTHTFYSSSLKDGGIYVLVVGDYAGNTRMYQFTWGNPQKLDDKVIAYVRSYTSGGGERNRGDWITIRPDRFSTSTGGRSPTGMLPFAHTDLSTVLAGADAADNYLWQAFEDGRLYTAPLEDLNQRKLICDLSAAGMKTVRDLAFSEKDSLLYATDGSDTLWQIDPMNGHPKAVQHVQAGENSAALYGLAVSKTGTVYATSYDEAQKKSVLLSWKLPEGSDGTTASVDAQVYTPNTNLSYPYISLTWSSGDQDALYAACALNLDSPSVDNYMYRVYAFDPNGGSCNVDKSNQGFNGDASRLYNSMRGLVNLEVMPTLDLSKRDPSAPTGLTICGLKETMMVGDTFSLTAAPVPWDAEFDASQVTWQSSETSVATITPQGLLTAEGAGTATITATYTAGEVTVTAEEKVTVTAAPSIQVAALFREGDGCYYWESFNTATPNNRKRVSGTQNAYIVGTLNQEKDCLYLFNGLWGWRVDPATFEATPLEAAIRTQYVHGDAAPGRSSGYYTNFGYMTILNSRVHLFGGNIQRDRNGFETVSVSLSIGAAQTNGPVAGMAYMGAVDNYEAERVDENSPKSADVYYLLTEGGDLYKMCCYIGKVYDKYQGKYYDQEATHLDHLGHVDGVSLPGVSSMSDGATASMIYDQTSKQLVLVSKIQNTPAKVQVIDPATHSLVMTREFDDDVRQVGILYQYDYSDYEDKTPKPTAEVPRIQMHALPASPEGHVTLEETKQTVTVTVPVEGTTNGLTTLTYDPDLLTFSGLTTPIPYTSFHNDGSKGELTVAFADGAEITGKTITVTFTYEPQETAQTATLTFREKEKGDPKTEPTLETWTETVQLPAKKAPRVLESIQITHQPNKTVYLEGDAGLDTTGLEVTACYSDGSQEKLTEGEYTVTGYLSTPGTHTITVTYEGLTATFEIRVQPKSLESIKVSKNPAKMEYIEGTKFEDAGMELTLHYNNGTEETVTSGWTIGTYDFSKPGTATVPITYDGKSTSLEVTVVAKSLESIQVSKNPTKMEYIEGTQFEDAGMELTLHYNNGTEENVTSGWTIGTYDFSKPGTATVPITYGGKSTSLTVTVVAKTLTGIKVTTLPRKLDYLEGKENLDVTGGKLTLYYNNDTSAEIGLTLDMVTGGFDNTKPGKQTVTVAYGGFTATFEVTVVAKSLESIQVSKNPTKMEYIEGTKFDDTGMELTLVYNNGTSETVKTGWEIGTYDFSTPGKATVPITYGGKSTSLEVTVVAKSLESIKVSKNPTKMTYIEGTQFEDAGMELTLHYDNGTEETITTGWTIGDYDFSNPGKVQVPITYGGKSTSLEVTVVAKSLESIKVSKNPDKMEYIEGTKFDDTGMELTLHYDNGTEETVTTGWTIGDYDFSNPGKATVPITYGGKSTSLEVTVVAKSLTGIQITTLPQKLVYLEGRDSLDVTGGKLTLTYDNGTTEEINLTLAMVTGGFDNTTPGIQTVLVTYGGFTATFQVTVQAKEIDHIAITHAPEKMEYVEGTDFAPQGMEVTVFYNNGTSQVLTQGWEVAYDFSEVGESPVTVTYRGHSAVLTVKVVAKTLTHIEVTQLPELLEYWENGEFDGTGMALTLYYDNGTTQVVTEGWTVEYDFSTSGTREVTVRYGGLETVITVTVKAAEPTVPESKPVSGDSQVPQTGDSSFLLFWLLLLPVSGGMLAWLALWKKRYLTR